jgi:hypothetical protein
MPDTPAETSYAAKTSVQKNWPWQEAIRLIIVNNISREQATRMACPDGHFTLTLETVKSAQ